MTAIGFTSEYAYTLPAHAAGRVSNILALLTTAPF